MKNRRIYLSGALAAREFLRQTQMDLRLHRRFQPTRLREELNALTFAQPHAYRAGFVDAICAYVLMSLEGISPNPNRWDVMVDVER